MTLKQKLEYHYKAFDKSAITPDPLQFLHLFKDRNNIEIMGFLASVFAYGNINQITASLNKILKISSGDPYNYITGFNADKELTLKHRFYTPGDISVLFLLLKKAYKHYGSLENIFMQYHSKNNLNIRQALSGFSGKLLKDAEMITGIENITGGIRFMFPDPEAGSACKRTNLFLRWMVRKDELDFGLWQEIRTDQLVIPVDTHIARISRKLNLTRRKNISWKMAEEITENLKRFDPSDPVKYDFALCHIGARKLKL